METKNFSDLLKDAMGARHLRQADIVRAAANLTANGQSLTSAKISFYANDHAIPSPEMIKLIALAMGMTDIELCGCSAEEYSKQQTDFRCPPRDGNVYLPIRRDVFARRLREAMDFRGLNQNELALAAGPYCKQLGSSLSRQIVSKYVKGEHLPGYEIISALANALRVSELWLIGCNVEMCDDDLKAREQEKLAKQQEIKEQKAVKTTLFAIRLKEEMEKRGWNAADLAKAAEPYAVKMGINLGQTSVLGYLAEKNTPDIFRLRAIALALDVSELWLLGCSVGSIIQPVEASESAKKLSGRVAPNRNLVATRIRQAMEKQGLTSADVVARAEEWYGKYRIHLTPQQMNGYLHAYHLPPLDRLHLIADALGVSFQWLIGQEEENPMEAKLLEAFRYLNPQEQQKVLEDVEYTKNMIEAARLNMFGERLREAAKKSNVSIAQMGKALAEAKGDAEGYPGVLASRYFLGQKYPEGDDVAILAKAVGVSPEWLLGKADSATA